MTTLKELDDAGVQVCLASDNTRDQFYGYGDLDMLEIFRESCRIGHLDRPIANWPMAVTSRPATVMGLNANTRPVSVGGPANLVVFEDDATASCCRGRSSTDSCFETGAR